MAVPKWKYQKPKKVSTYNNYIHLNDGKLTTLRISDWNFDKNPYNDSLFSTAVDEEDGQKVDKIWSVWDFDLKGQLKKSLKKYNPRRDKVTIKVKRSMKDEEDSFEFEMVEEQKQE